MNLAPATLTDPHQPTLPGLEPDVIATYSRYSSGNEPSPVKLRADKPIDSPTFPAFDQAVDAARTIMLADRKEARWGLFNRHPGRVESIALIDSEAGVKLVRTTLAIDPYKEPVPGQMFPGQNWWVGSPGGVRRSMPSTLALVGADLMFDLRDGSVAAPIEFPKA